MRGVLRAAIVCGMSVQILLGLAWLVKNMGGSPSFQESRWLLTGEGMAGKLYSGALYRGLARALSSCLWLLYSLQLAAAAVAAYSLSACFLGKEQRPLRIWAALALTTVPQALQCHLAALPWSFGTSLLMAETALWISLLRGENPETDGERVRTALAMAQLWMLLLLILPVYALFSLPLLAAALWRARKGGGRKRRLLCGLAGFALLVCCVGANCGLNPAAWNRELAANALSRAGWPSFQYDYEYITEPLHSEIGLDTARKVSAYADGVEISLIPRLEERYTPEETTSVLWELARFCLRRNLRADVKNVVWDMAAYHATPPILAMQLKGRAYDSLSGLNYELMKERAPLLSRYYVTYACRWWWVMLGMALLLAGITLAERVACTGRAMPVPADVFAEKGKSELTDAHTGENSVDSGACTGKERKFHTGGGRHLGVRAFAQRWFPVLAGTEWMILYFVAQGSGIMDYKKTLWVTVFWYVAALSRLGNRKGRER